MIFHIVGTRPNFMKLAPLHAELRSRKFDQKIIHTGQHYDDKMYEVFFKQLEIPTPDFNLGVGSLSHAHQTAEMMIRIEEVFNRERPDLLIVYGDVNSTMAGALVASKMGIKIAHVEAGLRSFDRRMPEEINRLVTDSISDIYFTPSIDANENLLKEGVDHSKIKLVGNIMIDSLVKCMPTIDASKKIIDLEKYILCTVHRPSNVDNDEKLLALINSLESISRKTGVVFPVHPRTKKRLELIGYNINKNKNLHFIEPVGYFEFIKLQKNAIAVITDSGGIQEETTFLGIPCLTLRENTERPITISQGTNMLIGFDYELLKNEIERILVSENIDSKVPEFWDGNTAERIVKELIN
ncbi:UDP-N-acetylglucosamine 2-epimerase (non-hydrolyzing) [Marivirga sp. S37H4]|uniref:UDP-N-acetylglucosamine 2-epimerase (Non-hydrolyzing) n=1 Tax=Marivirga aurantiaca TaxID=2802615 RepID=A0A934X164_9BACT|nr:UDP-N-acetylglucosamine 2-epimerase (non-hydrolyzing) [Marivirga aurantiaca]MBK6267014.1 UDP-N-acetylglucosamine 2-epimerase (non-hydrolyzing) [Marivirga aurantiaca]